MIPVDTILCGDSLSVLKGLPADSVDCVVTSPPYWGLRDYGHEGQLGLEKTFNEYIDKLCAIFDEVRRVLKPEGTCWVNLGDSYSGSTMNGGKNGFEPIERNFIQKNRIDILSDKCLCNIPARFSIEMCNRGWILRNVIIWHKRNCMPSSVTDRFTVDFEYMFFFVKQKRYWFEQQFDKCNEDEVVYREKLRKGKKYENAKEPYKNNFPVPNSNKDGRNKRTVWTINPRPYSEAHFAVYPEELCETPIKAGCPEKGLVLDPFIGSGTTGLVAKKLGRHYLGIELNPEYITLAKKRIGTWLF